MGRLLGFRAIAHFRKDLRGRLCWNWELDLPGGSKRQVWLRQYQAVSDVTVDQVAYELRTEKQYVAVPNLKRVAVVSMPLADKNGDSHELFNQRLVAGLDQAIQ